MFNQLTLYQFEFYHDTKSHRTYDLQWMLLHAPKNRNDRGCCHLCCTSHKLWIKYIHKGTQKIRRAISFIRHHHRRTNRNYREGGLQILPKYNVEHARKDCQGICPNIKNTRLGCFYVTAILSWG